MSKDVVRKSRARATAMANLFPEEGQADVEKATRIAYLMNIQKEPVGVAKLEEILEIFSVQPEYIDRFLSLYKMDATELELRCLIKKAIDLDENLS